MRRYDWWDRPGPPDPRRGMHSAADERAWRAWSRFPAAAGPEIRRYSTDFEHFRYGRGYLRDPTAGYVEPRRGGYDRGYFDGPPGPEPDGRIEAAVRGTLEDDRWLDAGRIEVSVEDGIVTLEGDVDDYLELRYAWDDAWETPGVRGVVCRLEVRPPER